MFGRLRIPLFEKKNGKNGKTKNCAKTKREILEIPGSDNKNGPEQQTDSKLPASRLGVFVHPYYPLHMTHDAVASTQPTSIDVTVDCRHVRFWKTGTQPIERTPSFRGNPRYKIRTTHIEWRPWLLAHTSERLLPLRKTAQTNALKFISTCASNYLTYTTHICIVHALKQMQPFFKRRQEPAPIWTYEVKLTYAPAPYTVGLHGVYYFVTL